LLVLGHPKHSSSSTDTEPILKFECHSETAIWLKECSPKVSRSKGFSSGFTELHTKLDADTQLDFAIHRRQNETQSQKSTCIETMHVHSAVSSDRLMQ
jgi:hypothetical protein